MLCKGMSELTYNHHLFEQLKQLVSEENVKVNQPLKDYTYTRFGGQADYFVTPETYNHVQEVVKLSNRVGVPFTLVGNGSNLIIKDGGIRGIVMNLSKLNRVTTTGTTIVSQSGARIIDVSREALANNLRSEERRVGKEYISRIVTCAVIS